MEIKEMYSKEWLSINPDAKKIIWENPIFHKVIIENEIVAVRRLGKDKDGVLTSYNVYVLPKFRRKAKVIIENSISHYLSQGRFKIFKPTKRIQELLEIKPKFKFEKSLDFWEVKL